MNISTEPTNLLDLPEVPFEFIRLNVHYTNINWDPIEATHKDFNWKNFEAALTRLENKIVRGDTITSIVVTTKGSTYVS